MPEDSPLVLIGENNAGKSNIVRGLDLVLGQTWTGNHDPEDHEFFGRDRTLEIEIVASFDRNDPLAGRYTQVIWSYGMEVEGEAAHRVAPSRYDGRRTDYMSNDIKSSCVCVVIEADRNLNYHLSYASKYTFLSRLMHRFHKALTDDEATKTELELLFQEVKGRFERIQPYARFAATLKEQLGGFAGSMTHRLEVDFQAYNPVNFFHALRLHATDGDEPRTLDELGTGEQQILALSFAYAYATAFHGGIILVIEEPESHLHPLAQRWLARRVKEMCADGLQIVITTHSAHFIDVLNLEGIVLVRKDDAGTNVTQLTRREFSDYCVRAGAPPERTTPESILPFYASMVTPEILEGFFAKAVVLVEGRTEALALPVYLEKCGLIPSRDGIAIIPVGGKGNLAKWRRLFSAYEVPTFIIFDNDGRKDDRDGVKRRDALRAVGIPDDVQDRYITAETWIIEDDFMVFGRNFEASLRDTFPDYRDLEAEARELGIDGKPFVARWVAEHLEPEDGPGWTQFRELAHTIGRLIAM